jgi:hypothetical protein
VKTRERKEKEPFVSVPATIHDGGIKSTHGFRRSLKIYMTIKKWVDPDGKL